MSAIVAHRRTRPSATEVIGAAACALLALGGLVALPILGATEPGNDIPSVSPSDVRWWVVVVLILGQAVALLWAKRAPRTVLSVVAIMPLVHAVAIPGETFSLVTVAVSFGFFWAVLREPMRRLAVVLPFAFLLVALSQVINEVRTGSALSVGAVALAGLQAIAVAGIPLVIGLFVGARQEARIARGNELAALRGERNAVIQAAVSRERMAMSRELHDIAAHHMSGIALLSSAIYRQIDTDPAAAKLSAQQVRAQSTTVLDDLRRVIGLLREEGESTRSVETLAAVRELVDLRRSDGVNLSLRLLTAEDELGAGLGPLAQLIAYRMVQESIANVVTHAPGANCVVEIDDTNNDRVTIVVENDGAHAPDPGPGCGFGLVGMRERADLVAGELLYGATANGGWQVRLTLKRDAIINGVTEAKE